MSSKVSRVSPIQEFRDKPSKTHHNKDTRSCSHEGCSVKLSRYNLTYYCSVHERIHTSPKSLI